MFGGAAPVVGQAAEVQRPGLQVRAAQAASRTPGVAGAPSSLPTLTESCSGMCTVSLGWKLSVLSLKGAAAGRSRTPPLAARAGGVGRSTGWSRQTPRPARCVIRVCGVPMLTWQPGCSPGCGRGAAALHSSRAKPGVRAVLRRGKEMCGHGWPAGPAGAHAPHGVQGSSPRAANPASGAFSVVLSPH